MELGCGQKCPGYIPDATKGRSNAGGVRAQTMYGSRSPMVGH